MLALSIAMSVAATPSLVAAQGAAISPDPKKTVPVVRPKPAKKPPRDKYGTPLDTFMNTHLTTTAPPAEDFVRATHPAAADLDYTSLTGDDPVRPKPRDKANIEALQAELEHDGAAARTKGAIVGGAPEKTPKHKAKPR